MGERPEGGRAAEDAGGAEEVEYMVLPDDRVAEVLALLGHPHPVTYEHDGATIVPVPTARVGEILAALKGRTRA